MSRRTRHRNQQRLDDLLAPYTEGPTVTHPRNRNTNPFVCSVCGGPCRQYAGTVHGWKCRSCLDAGVARQKGHAGARKR